MPKSLIELELKYKCTLIVFLRMLCWILFFVSNKVITYKVITLGSCTTAVIYFALYIVVCADKTFSLATKGDLKNIFKVTGHK